MTTENTANVTLDRLEFNTPAGVPVSVGLSSPLTLPAGRYSPYAVCRMCAVRLSLKTLERLLLLLVLDELECGVSHPHSYSELGRTLCKCAHSVKSAMASLRAAGLVVTSRVGFGDSSLSVSCDAFLRWAERVTAYGESVSENAASVSSTSGNVSMIASRRTQPRRVMKPRNEELAAKKEDPVMSLEEQLREAREQEVAMYRQADGSLYPGVWLDDEGHPHFDASSGNPFPPCLQAADMEDVDPSGEIAATLAAAGRKAGGSGATDDSDDFSFGSDTADTDIGHGVAINPDI